MNRSGLVLAGGASQRFGEAKPLATFEGRPLVRWVSDALAPRCDEILLSIGVHADGGPFQDAVPGARLVRDVRADRGPIEGFHQGFLSARGDLVLVAPADAPLLQTRLYDALISVLGDHEAAIPRRKVADPVRAVYRRESVLHGLSADPDSPSALMDHLDAVFLEGSALQAADPAAVSFVDVNRREDLEGARRLAGSAALTDTDRHRY